MLQHDSLNVFHGTFLCKKVFSTLHFCESNNVKGLKLALTLGTRQDLRMSRWFVEPKEADEKDRKKHEKETKEGVKP